MLTVVNFSSPGRTQLLVGVDARCEFLHTREVGIGVAPGVGVGGPDLLIRRDLECSLGGVRGGLIGSAAAAAEGHEGQQYGEASSAVRHVHFPAIE